MCLHASNIHPLEFFLKRIASLLRISKIKTAFLLPWRDIFLFFEAFVISGVIRVVILAIPFKFTAKYLGNSGTSSQNEPCGSLLHEITRIRNTLRRIGNNTPWNSNCLVLAITGKILLRQQKLSNTLYLGVMREGKSSLAAHAWLTCGNVIITGGTNVDAYSIVGSFSDSYTESTGG